jgi:primosomal protein N' (replication factor Y)
MKKLPKAIKVIPIGLRLFETLTYLSDQTFKKGDIIEIEIRKKKYPAIVIETVDIKTLKQELRKADYTLKKIPTQKARNVISDEFVKTIEYISTYFVQPISSVFDLFIPKVILSLDYKTTSRKLSNSIKTELIIENDDKRYDEYIERVKKTKGSTYILTPTVEIAKRVYQHIKGRTDNVFMLHGQVSGKKIEKETKKIIKEKKPVTIIGTYKFLSIPRSDISLLIIDSENNSAYRTIKGNIDVRVFAQKLAEYSGANLILADNVVRIETVYKYRKENLLSIKYKSKNLKVVDVSYDEESPAGSHIVSKELDQLIKKTIKNKERIFLFNIKRGLATTTVCRDCGTYIMCSRCSFPMVLHRKNEANFFMCHKCGQTEGSALLCGNCQGWNLDSIGIGTDAIYEEIKRKYRNIEIFQIDADTAKTSKQIEKVISEFEGGDNPSILIGNQKALNVLNEVDASAIISLDSLFSIPDFYINEKIFKIFVDLSQKTKNQLIMQTRNIDQPVIQTIKSGDFKKLYDNEIKLRKQLNYPPFSILVKILVTGEEKKIMLRVKEVENILPEYKFESFPAFIHRVKNKYIFNIVLTLNRWPDEKVLEKVYSLPQYCSVVISPSNIL